MLTQQKELIDAAKSGDTTKILQLVRQQGATVDWPDEDDNDPDSDTLAGATALHYAAEAKQLAAATTLLDLGADVNAYDGSLWTPLHYAVDEKNKPMVELLIARGADVAKPGQCMGCEEVPVNLGVTPLHMAYRDRLEIPEILAVLLAKFNTTGRDINTLKTADFMGSQTPTQFGTAMQFTPQTNPTNNNALPTQTPGQNPFQNLF